MQPNQVEKIDRLLREFSQMASDNSLPDNWGGGRFVEGRWRESRELSGAIHNVVRRDASEPQVLDDSADDSADESADESAAGCVLS